VAIFPISLRHKPTNNSVKATTSFYETQNKSYFLSHHKGEDSRDYRTVAVLKMPIMEHIGDFGIRWLFSWVRQLLPCFSSAKASLTSLLHDPYKGIPRHYICQHNGIFQSAKVLLNSGSVIVCCYEHKALLHPSDFLFCGAGILLVTK
jgi:hypothetical protein